MLKHAVNKLQCFLFLRVSAIVLSTEKDVDAGGESHRLHQHATHEFSATNVCALGGFA